MIEDSQCMKHVKIKYLYSRIDTTVAAPKRETDADIAFPQHVEIRLPDEAVSCPRALPLREAQISLPLQL